MNKKCLIGIPCGSGNMSAYFVDGLFKMNRPVDIPTSLIIIERQPVDIARNYILELAIKLDVDYVLFLDDDGVIPPDTLIKLLEDDKDMVGAPMLTRTEREDGNHALCCFMKEDFYIGDGKNINKYNSAKFTKDIPFLQKVDAIGGACMLLKKELFTAVFKKYNGRPFEYLHEVYETEENGITVRQISEDMLFSERVKNLGFDIYVDLRIRPVHLGRPKFIRFEMEGENLTPLKNPIKNTTLLSETLNINK